MLNVVWDMETNDPDDFITLLLFLLGHPRVDLKAVTITPGTTYQVGLVRKALSWFNKNGAPDAELESVQQNNFEWFVENMAKFLIEKCQEGRLLPKEYSWSKFMLPEW